MIKLIRSVLATQHKHMSACLLCSKDGCDFETRCGHSFHKTCLQNEIKKNWLFHCPKCDKKVSLNNDLEQAIRDPSMIKVDVLDLLVEQVAEENDLELLKRIEKLGGNIHYNNEATLGIFGYNGNMEAVKYLVENCDADINAAFVHCAQGGHLDIVRYLVERGADYRIYNDSAFCMSAQDGHLDVVKYLHELGAEIHAQGEYALAFSALRGQMDVVKYLLEHGADIHYNDDEPFRDAVEGGHMDVIRYMIEKGGANIDAAGKFALAHAAETGKIELLEYLLTMDKEGIHDAVIFSIDYGNLDTLKFLVRIGGGADIKYEEALKVARRSGNDEILKYLTSEQGTKRKEQ